MKIINSKIKNISLIFFQELFYVLAVALLIFSLMEAFWPRMVLAYININLVLILWLAAGMIILQINQENKK